MGAEKHGRFSTCWKTYVLGESSRSLSRNIRPGLQPLRQRNIIIPSTVMSLPCPPRSPAIATLRWELDAWKRTLPAMSTQVSSHCDEFSCSFPWPHSIACHVHPGLQPLRRQG